MCVYPVSASMASSLRREGFRDGKIGDSRDMKQQWQEERPDQTEIKAKNIPQINTKHTPLTRSNGWEESLRMPLSFEWRFGGLLGKEWLCERS